MYDFFKSNNVKINKKIATALYTGLLDDSNGFMDDNVTRETFSMAQDLIKCGADYKVCNHKIMKSVSLAGLRLKAIMLNNMTLECEARVAIFCVSQDDMKATGAEGSDCELALEESLYLPHVEVSVLIKENSNFSIKGSIRSKGKIDASKIALNFGGGGHFIRSGFEIRDNMTLQEAKEEILNLIKKEM